MTDQTTKHYVEYGHGSAVRVKRIGLMDPHPEYMTPERHYQTEAGRGCKTVTFALLNDVSHETVGTITLGVESILSVYGIAPPQSASGLSLDKE